MDYQMIVPSLDLYVLRVCVRASQQTWVEVPSGVESSVVDGGGKSVTADGLGDVDIEVSIKPKCTQTGNIWEFTERVSNSFVGGAALAFLSAQIYNCSTTLLPIKGKPADVHTELIRL